MSKDIKIIIIALVLIFLTIVNGWNNNTIQTVIDFNNKGDEKAEKILYDYVLSENADNVSMSEYVKEAGISAAKAFFADLNDDGENEIIGHFYGSLYMGTLGRGLFILEKQNKGYVDISSQMFTITKPIWILRHKTNGYHDIKLFGIKGNNQPSTIKFNKKQKMY